MKKYLIIRHRADNDGNGNPRRGWLVSDGEGHRIGWIDEGYKGRRALDLAMGRLDLNWRDSAAVVDACPARLTAGEYRKLERMGFEAQPVTGAAVSVYGVTEWALPGKPHGDCAKPGRRLRPSEAANRLERGHSVAAMAWCPSYRRRDGGDPRVHAGRAWFEVMRV